MKPFTQPIFLLAYAIGTIGAPSKRTCLTRAVTTNTSYTNVSSTRIVAAHHIVGNTYPYTQANWAADIALAASKGIDAFALNIGSDTWEPARVADAYAAAKASNTSFKLFLSYDMTSLPCSSASNVALIQNYTKTYAGHSSQLMYNGKPLFSTFSGESCTFGQSSVQNGWQYTLKSSGMPSLYFVPSFFIDPATFSSYSSTDGQFNWNGGWPLSNNDVNFTTDSLYINNLKSKIYMASVSPWFFTHYGVDSYNKNWIYRPDDWLLASKWEQIIANRANVSLVEMISWNDYGESHYMGPIEGAQPNSQSWVNGFNHSAWLDVNQYYATAYKNGTYPTITKDKVYMWARLQPANATASNDSVGKPTNWQWTQDYLWSIIMLTKPANVTLSCGTSQTNTTVLPAGLQKMKLPLKKACSAKAVISRNGSQVLSFSPTNFTFTTSPTTYNFNALVAGSS